MRRPLLYFHTLRHLKPRQIFWRVFYRMFRGRPDLHAPPEPRQVVSGWRAVARTPSMLGRHTFRFLATTREIPQQSDWNRSDWPKLWLYNLHYFDDLNANHAVARTRMHRALLTRWVRENPAGHGNGWEPYPTSLRIVNWTKWAWAGNSLEPEIHHSLAIQSRWIASRLEWHLLGNHLFANAKALVFAGVWFAGAEADKWRTRGLAILQREVAEQILPDGGHFERSPMYHAIVLEDLLDLIQLASLAPGVIAPHFVGHWRDVASQMLHWLASMNHPDGQIGFFNDAAFGIAPTLEQLLGYAQDLGVSFRHEPIRRIMMLPQSGYARLQNASAVLLADVGLIGPDYLPGHAHADTLSFEWSLHGQRVVVNSGISQYGDDAERLRQRGTAAHSTVQLDGRDSSEIWGGFRVARRARPFNLDLRETTDTIEVGCSHDGYRRLRPSLVHRRTWKLAARTLQVFDVVEGAFLGAVARYHLHPDVEVSGNGAEGTLLLPRGHRVHWALVDGLGRVVPSTWHPAFGVSVTSTCLEVAMQGHAASIVFSWD